MVSGDSAGIPESDWNRLEDQIAAFEAAWKRGDRPNIGDFLADDEPLRPNLLIELVHTEIEFRLKLGESARVEEYLHRFPSLARNRSTVLDLIRVEWTLRRRREPQLSLGDLLERFPEFRGDFETAPTDAPTGMTPPIGSGSAGSKVSEPIDLPLPRRFGKYELRQWIGSGSFGVVYRAWDTLLNREVAIKIPRPEAIAAHRNVRAFLREARNAIDLHHPNIVAIHDAGPIEGTICIVRAYVEGSTLADQIRDQPLAPEEAAALMILVAGALEHAHQKGIIHRDLKPSNILLDHRGQPYLVDFALAKRQSGDSTLSLGGQRGTMIGTPAYMAPEQARGEPQDADARSDVFSAGVILYELLTGSVPFRGRGRMLLAQIQGLEPTPPRTLNEDVTTELEAICLKALAKSPDDRHESAQAFADDLRTYLVGRSKSAPTDRPRRKFEPRRRIRSIPLALAGLLLFLLLTGTFWVMKAQERRNQSLARLTEQSLRALLDLARPTESMGLGTDEPPRRFLSRVWRELDELAPTLEREPALIGLAAETHRRLAERARSLGSDPRAREHWEKTAKLAETLVEADPGDRSRLEDLAVALANLAAILRRSTLDPTTTEPRQLLERSRIAWETILDDRRRQLLARPDDADLQLDVAEAILHRLEVEIQLGRTVDLDEVEKSLPEPSRRCQLPPLVLVRLAGILVELANLQLAEGFPRKSLTSGEDAYQIGRSLPDGPAVETGLARASLVMGRSSRALERPHEAGVFDRRAIKHLESLVRRHPDSADLRRLLGQAHHELGILLDRPETRADAIAADRRSLAIRDRLVRDEPVGYLNLIERAETEASLALEDSGTPVLSTWLGVRAIADRLKVVVIAPGLVENRRDLVRFLPFFVRKTWSRRPIR